MISNIANIYDMMGWFSPTIIKLKSLVKTMGIWLWLGQVSSNEHSQNWKIENRIAYALHFNSSLLHIKIRKNTVHSVAWFCDMPESVYAVVVYIRSELEQGQIDVVVGNSQDQDGAWQESDHSATWGMWWTDIGKTVTLPLDFLNNGVFEVLELFPTNN